MDEPRDEPAPPQPVVGAGRLPSVQETYGVWTRHCLGCARCRDVDAGRCDTADRLWRAYQVANDRACKELNETT